MEKCYKETSDEMTLMRLGEELATYFIDVKFMACYWKELLDYLEYDPTFIKLFIKTYNTRYKFDEDIELPVEVRNSHMVEVSKEIRKAIIRDKIKNFWKK